MGKFEILNQLPEKLFEICEEDFNKTMFNYLLYKEGIDTKELEEVIVEKILYNSNVEDKANEIRIRLKKENKNESRFHISKILFKNRIVWSICTNVDSYIAIYGRYVQYFVAVLDSMCNSYNCYYDIIL